MAELKSVPSFKVILKPIRKLFSYIGKHSIVNSVRLFSIILTQQKIKELTGFSAGMISQGLNYLIKEGLIRRKKIKGVREKLYIMDSIAFSNFLWIYKKLKILEKWDPIINKTMDELKKKEKMKLVIEMVINK